uniref:Uncharacterized protein n=1 Tax=Cajanus cajan TaxID=3821 RepID=A0A151RY86_CAJCA|nr:hypothetical protein KK1_030826 [Cajanus cajan]
MKFMFYHEMDPRSTWKSSLKLVFFLAFLLAFLLGFFIVTTGSPLVHCSKYSDCKHLCPT